MKKKMIKKILGVSVISTFILQMVYFSFEPALTLATSSPDSVVVTLNVDAGVSITPGADEIMEPSISLTSNKSIGTSSWSVATNSNTGYSLAVKASTNPALKNGTTDQFTDYTEATPDTPETWSVSSGQKEFGYSAYGTDVLDATWGTHNDCGNTSTGVVSTGSKYLGFSTTDFTIATHSGVTTPSGVVTNICFAAEQNGVYAQSGSYTATITATATAS